MNKNLNDIVEQFKFIDSIEAIVLAGSVVSNNNDELSDYDLYVYTDSEIDIKIRTQIAKIFSDNYEINNQYFETGDEWILKDSHKVIDIMYRSLKWSEQQVENVLIKNNASVGYSTCILYNIKNSEILYDKTDWFKTLQDKLDISYPEKLAENIIRKNLPLLKNKLCASYKEQILKAKYREDFVSVNHRISAFLASYFDILFAINKILHPGEKRLIEFAHKYCKKLPKHFKEDLLNLLTGPDNIEEILDSLVNNLEEIL